MTGPKPVVLPITPSGSIEVPVRFELTNNGFAIHPLKPLGYRTLSAVGGTFPVGPALTYSTFGWMMRFELTTSWTTIRRSNQLNYNHHFVPKVGLEPTHFEVSVPKTDVSTIPPLRQVAGHRLTCGGCTFHLVPLRYYDFFVPPQGLEPWTPTLKVWYSSQLS